MKRNLFWVVAAMAIMTGCGDKWTGAVYPQSHWGDDPLHVEEYHDADGRLMYSTTYFSWDKRGRLDGYGISSTISDRHDAEMTNSNYSGTTHSYETRDYRWVGGPLPVIYRFTDTYSDATFKNITKRVINVDDFLIQITVDYHYDGGLLTRYHTVVTGSDAADFETEIKRIKSESTTPDMFPQQAASGNDKRVEIVYTNAAGNLTGYYTDNDLMRWDVIGDARLGGFISTQHSAQWGFVYGETAYTYITGTPSSPYLVRVTTRVLPE